MKQNKIINVIAGGVLVALFAAITPAGVSTTTGLLEDAIDVNNNGTQLAVRNVNVGEIETVSYSKTFVQTGVNEDTGNHVMRFATAVSGPIKSLKYVRTIENLPTKEKEVTSVYKGIISGDQVAYYNGSELVYEESELTNNYYWACYSIEFANESSKDLNINVKLEITGENNEVYLPTEKVTSFNNEYVAPVVLSRLEIVGEDTITHGTLLEDYAFTVKGLYSDGSERELEASEYTVALPSQRYAKLGYANKVVVTSTENTSVSVTKTLSVVQRLEGENATIVGGKSNAEPEYVLENGTYVKLDNVGFAGGFAESVRNGKEGSITFDFVSQTEATGGFKIRMSNSYSQKDADGYYSMADLQMNSILDIYVNGQLVDLSDDVIISGAPTYPESGKYAPLYGLYHTIDFTGLSFVTGINQIKIQFKNSTLGQLNAWNESPSESNIDYIDVYSRGSDLDLAQEVVSISIDPLNKTAFEYGMSFEEAKLLDVRTIATLADGTRKALDPSDVKITSVNTDTVCDLEGAENHIIYGDYVVNVSLVDNENITASFVQTVVAPTAQSQIFKVTDGYLEKVGDSVIYVLKGTCKGQLFNEAEVLLYDGSTNYAYTKSVTLNAFEMRSDVTNYSAKTTDRTLGIIPHIKYNGELYHAHKSGDVVNVNIHTKGYVVGNKYYYIVNYYNMPTLCVDQFNFSDRHLVVNKTELVEKDGVVYFKASGHYAGEFDPSEISIFDGSTVLNMTYTFVENVFEGIIDVSTIAAGTYYLHLKVGSTMYPTGSAGDIKNWGLNVVSATIGNCKLSTKYSMPIITIS